MKTNTRSALGHPHPRKPAACSTIEVLESRIAPATIVVNNPTDTPEIGTLHGKPILDLRQALAQADADLVLHQGVVNTIVFQLPAPPAHGENIITLNGTQLTSKGDVDIVGPGAGKLIINGNNASRVLFISDSNGSTLSPATISGVSIINGKVTGYGGGIYSSESLTLKNVVISGNQATADGGGVDVFTGFTLPGSATISNSLITGNSSNSTSGGGGGGGLQLNDLHAISISNSVITGNNAKANLGGGVFAHVLNPGTSITITGCQISGNSAGSGGGVFVANDNSAPTSKITISGTHISGNTSINTTVSGVLSGGGGLFASSGNTVITGSIISANVAQYSGGGIQTVAGVESLTIKGSTISGNSTLTTPTSKFQGVYVQGGGGVSILGGSNTTLVPVQVTRSQITGNRDGTHGGGGGLEATGGIALTVSSSTISGNTTIGAGGGLSEVGFGTNKVNLTVAGCVFSDNFGLGGGGLESVGDGIITITASKVTGNTGTDFGGGIEAESTASLTIKNVTVTDNVSSLSYGGGIAIEDTPNFHLSGGSITGNQASTGGGVDIVDSSGSILGVTISGNVATSSGGGVTNGGVSPGTVTIQIAKVFANSAPVDPDVSGTFTFV